MTIPAGYLDEAAREERLSRLALQLGGTVAVAGHSVQHRAITAAVVPASSSSSSTVFINANLHGVEWIGGLCALGVLEALGTPQGQWLRERATVVVVPCLNPDGFARTDAALRRGESFDLKAVRTNANGVDLNRNFPRPHVDEARGSSWAASAAALAVSGSSDARRATWRGPAPMSEPEAIVVDELLAQHRPHAVLSFHSFMGTLIPPKVTTWREAQAYRRFARAYRAGQTTRWSPTLMCAPLDVFTGELEDHAHHRHDAWALISEVHPVVRSFVEQPRAPTLFARFNPKDPAPTVDDAVGGALSYLRAALDTPRPSVRFST
jgi:predicted deacylase